MTKLQKAVDAFNRRAQFHDPARLNAIIEAAREEERESLNALVVAAKKITDNLPTGF